MSKSNPISPLFKELFLNPKYNDLNLQECMIFGAILTFAYYEGPVIIDDNYLKKFIKAKSRETANRYVKSLDVKGCIKIDHPNPSDPGLRHITLVKDRIPKGYRKPLRKVVPLKAYFNS